MKRQMLIFLMLFLNMHALCWERDYGAGGEVIMKPINHPHYEWNIPADMPDVYYNSELDVITIVDYVNATYYVTIYDDWWNAVITDTKPGGGTINV